MMFARRTNWELSSNEITETLQGLKKEGVEVLNLTESNPTRCGFTCSKEILTALSDVDNLQYVADAQGMLKAREAVSQYYARKGFEVAPERIFLTSSTSEGYAYLFRLLADPGDAVLFPRPSYPLFQFLTDLNDVRMRTYLLGYGEGQWGIHQEEFRENFSSAVKAVAVVNPNNPTGSFVRQEELDFLNACCQEQETAIICDEVFFDFVLEEGVDRISLVNNDAVLTCVLGGVSKVLGLPQMKLSWIVLNGPKDVVKEARARLEVIADTYLSVNTPVQNALPKWLPLQETIQGEIKTRLKNNWEFCKSLVSAQGLQSGQGAQGAQSFRISEQFQTQNWYANEIAQKSENSALASYSEFSKQSQIQESHANEIAQKSENSARSRQVELLRSCGGWYAVLKISGDLSEEELVLELLNKEQVFVHPGYFFDFEGEGHIVLSLLLKGEVFREGVRRILNLNQILP